MAEAALPWHRPRAMPTHVSVHDAQGRSLVVEFIAGKMKMYSNDNGVLTNAPVLPRQLEALAQYGDHELPGGYESTARFLRLSLLNEAAGRSYAQPDRRASYLVGTVEQRVVADAVHMLNTVVRPFGAHVTQWSVVRDHKQGKLYVRSKFNQLLRVVQLQSIDFSSAAARRSIDVGSGDWYVDITSALTDPRNTARTMDLPPRNQHGALLQHFEEDPVFPAAFLSLSAHTAHASDPGEPTFANGVIVGILMAMLFSFGSKLLARMYHRHHYRRLPE